MSEARLAYFINEAIRQPNGELAVCIAREGEPGYYKTDYHYGRDLAVAREIVEGLNQGLGLDQAQVDRIIASTMRAR